jgi:hypothetical protein
MLIGLVALGVAFPAGWAAYAAATWATFGHTSSRGAADPAMTRYMPRYDIAEHHETRVAAPAEDTYRAASAMDMQRSPVVHAIFRAREVMLGAEPGPRRDSSFVNELRAIGWGVLEERPRQVVLGAVTQPWQANVVFRAIPAERYAAFDSAGYVKIVVTIAVDSLGPRESRLWTETRALATDGVSRAKFRRYWSIFSPGILLIRSEALRVVRRDAERSEAQRNSAAQ